MPTVTYNDSENISFELIPNGDYVVEVVKVETAISQKPKTKGCEQFDVQVKVESHPNCRIWDDLTFGYDKLQWKLDVFLKSMHFLVDGKPPVKGQNFEITPESLIGLRGWVTVGTREYTPTGSTEKKQVNEIKVWLTDKEKLARNVPVAAEKGEWD